MDGWFRPLIQQLVSCLCALLYWLYCLLKHREQLWLEPEMELVMRVLIFQLIMFLSRVIRELVVREIREFHRGKSR